MKEEDVTEKKPLYYQIYNQYKFDIVNGILCEGEPLPSERELSGLFDVSRATIRQALKKLEEDNFIYTIPGSGSFVSHKTLKQELTSFYSFYEEVSKAGKKPSSKVLYSEIILPNKELCEIFKTNSMSNILKIKRLRLIDEEPIIFEETYIPVNRFPDFEVEELNNVPMYTIFKEKYNVVFEKATESFSVYIVKNDEILLNLGYKKQVSCMLIKRLTFENDEVIEYTISYVKGDKYEYKVTLNNI